MDVSNKILEKIQKCLNLSKSSNPGEAANALRMAKAMMKKIRRKCCAGRAFRS